MRTILRVGLFICLAALPQKSDAGEWSGNVNMMLGAKLLDKDEWGKFDNQSEVGITADVTSKTWPVSLVAGFYYSSDSDSDYGDAWVDDRYRYTYYGENAYTTELNLGLKKIWELPRAWKISIAGGGMLVYGEVQVIREDNLHGYSRDTDDEGDAGFGYWGGIGITKTIAHHFDVGLEFRYSNAEIDLYHEERDAGGVHIGLILGYCWGGE